MKFLVAGLINLETTARVDAFPIAYQPVRFPFFGVRSTVSGVGYNVAKALHTLGHDLRFLSLIGDDAPGVLVRHTLHAEHLPADDVLPVLRETSQSVILYDGDGRRAINVDLKDTQETAYPADRFESALAWCDVAVLCNINFTRPFLQRAKALGKRIATDVHTISQLDDPYNRDYMQSADILFMSNENLPASPEDWAKQVMSAFGTTLIGIGLGKQGALLCVNQGNGTSNCAIVPAVSTRPVVNTIGAGDALFAAFLHAQTQTSDPFAALRKAVTFASWKIGVSGAADGYLNAADLDALNDAVMGR
ncbi:MAG: carbohydrate kinase family protein [Anaerolinea sp.]|nr:carbohydrate kinase family protein [Anaerolinea sp.]